jgi:phosphopantetheine adenylyltransferase
MGHISEQPMSASASFDILVQDTETLEVAEVVNNERPKLRSLGDLRQFL